MSKIILVVEVSGDNEINIPIATTNIKKAEKVFKNLVKDLAGGMNEKATRDVISGALQEGYYTQNYGFPAGSPSSVYITEAIIDESQSRQKGVHV